MTFSLRSLNLTASFSLLCGLLAVLVSCPLSQACAQNGKSLREAMLGRPAADGRDNRLPDVARFTSEDGESFVLDHTQPKPLIRFDGDSEVWVLTPTPGPKGDIIFKNDMGEAVLRSSRWGGLTLFSRSRPMGDPAAVSGKAEAFKAGNITPGLLFQHLARASKRASVALQRLMPFEADVQTPGADYLFADAANVTSETIVKVAAQNKGKKLLEPIREVHLIEGRPPGVYMEKDALIVRLDQSQGWGGRPSSKRITAVIKAAYKGS